MSQLEIKLGEHRIPVFAQRHAYLAHELGGFIDRLGGLQEELNTGSLIALGQSTIYELLSILVPQLDQRLPKYEFCGYHSRDAMESKDYNPELDKSPTNPEIIEAFEVITAVNRFNVFKHLGKIVDPTLLKAAINTVIAKEVQALTTSPNSLSGNGASASMSSMTPVPTSTENED